METLCEVCRILLNRQMSLPLALFVFSGVTNMRISTCDISAHLVWKNYWYQGSGEAYGDIYEVLDAGNTTPSKVMME